MYTRTICWVIFVFVVTIVHGEDVVASNDARNFCVTTSSMNTVVHDNIASNVCVLGSAVNDPDGQYQELPKGGCYRDFKGIWSFLALIILAVVWLIDWLSGHKIWRFIVWVSKLISRLVGCKEAKDVRQNNALQKAGNINCHGNGNVINNIIFSQNSVRQSGADAANAKTGGLSLAASRAGQSERKLNWDDIEKKFRPYSMIKVKASLKQIVDENLCTVEALRARCPKKYIPICVIDDKDDEKYSDGLKTLGYENVTIYPRCPTYDVLKSFAIVIFDVRGVGNAAGKDGFSLAVTFKSEYPLKVVGVRSAFLQDVSEADRGKLNFAIEKKRDLCDQLAPVLNAAFKDVGDPVAMWKKVRVALIETFSARELALMEHEYVQAIRLLAEGKDVLPGEWMDGVNRLLKRNLF